MSQQEPDRAYVYQPDPPGQPNSKFRCRNCRATFKRIDCSTRLGMLECPRCLPLAYTGTLEPIIYAIAGPSTSEHDGKRFSKDDADCIVKKINGKLALNEYFGQGNKSTCRYCSKEITLRGDRWLDSDGTARCDRGRIHSPNEHCSMPERIIKPQTPNHHQ